MVRNIAFLLFDGVAELDFVGPWQVFDASQWAETDGDERDRLYTVAADDGVVTTHGGMKIIPEYSFANAPKPDILVVPGAARPGEPVKNERLLRWVAEQGTTVEWLVGVCTGSMILAAAGLAKGKRISSHWAWLDALKENQDLTVLEKVRYVRDGNLLTSAGVTAGIDSTLWLIGQLHSPDHARQVRQLIEYYPAPPYAAEV